MIARGKRDCRIEEGLESTGPPPEASPANEHNDVSANLLDVGPGGLTTIALHIGNLNAAAIEQRARFHKSARTGWLTAAPIPNAR